MNPLADAFLHFARNSRWGTCQECPQDARGATYPEFCTQTAREDHQLNLEALVRHYEALTQTLPCVPDTAPRARERVRVTWESAQEGYDSDRTLLRKFLTLGTTYTVAARIVGAWRTEVYLEEVPGIPFNSVNFVPVA